MKVVLSIAGSDSGGCAGIQADIKTSEAFGCFCTTAITVLTAQNTTGVKAIYPIEAEFIKQQIQTLFEDYEISAIKTGMLYDKNIISTVFEVLKDTKVPIVVDPVCVSRSGDILLKDDAMEEYTKLFAIANVITPNIYEAKYILQRENSNKLFSNDNIDKFVNKYGTNLLIKQFSTEDNQTIDKLFGHNIALEFPSNTVKTKHNNGTGCSYSTAIACSLAQGLSLVEAIADAKRFIYSALVNSPQIGNGNGPIGHKKRSNKCLGDYTG